MKPEPQKRRLPEEAVQDAVDRALDRAGTHAENVDPEVREAAKKALAPWAVRLVYWLEDLIRVPGTRFGVGLDALVGLLLPGAGDAITGASSIGLLVYALRERVPTVILLRMLLNIAVDLLGGLFPIVGDAFDLLWRSNRRNLDLIEEYRHGQKAPSAVDYALVAIGMLLAIASAVVPIVILWILPASLFYGAYRALFGG